MGKHRRSTAKHVRTTLLAVVAITLMAYLGVFEGLGAWAAQREPWLLGPLLAASIVLAAASGFCWTRLRREAKRHEREVAEGHR